MEIITCKVCGMPLKRRQTIYCSKECKYVCTDWRKTQATNQKGKRHSLETKKKMRVLRKGKNNAMFGKHHSEETKRKISEKAKGRIFTEETRIKLSKASSGRKHSEKTKKKISKTIKEKYSGKNHPWFGKHLSEEHKRKLSNSLKGKKNPMYGKGHLISGKRNGMYGRSGEKNPNYGKPAAWKANKWAKKGKHELGHRVRSSWEFKFAQFLQNNHINYLYEPKKFEVIIDGCKNTYTPDFYIPKQDNGGLWLLPFPPDSYVEIKGYMRELDQKKIDYFREHYTPIIVLDKDNLTNIVNLRETKQVK